MSAASAQAVFLSYASQDAAAAKKICEALRSGGVEVWFDADGGLEHGDEWDAKIRRQIKECVLFIPVISASTQARHEGYFRLEWELAAQRAMSIASGVPFILPVVIDDTREPDALVPDRFRMVQWTRLRGGEVPPEVLQRFLKLWSRRTGALKHGQLETGHPRPDERDEGVASPTRFKVDRRVPAAAWGVAVLAFALAVGGYFWLKRPMAPAPTAAPVEPAVARSSTLAQAGGLPSPARQFAAKARALFENPDYTRDDLLLAEDYCKQALKLDENDAEVWATYAELNAQFIGGREDISPERRELARFQAERAIKLAPNSTAARFAKARVLVLLGDPGSRGEAETLLRQLADAVPSDPRVLNLLGKVVGNFGRQLDRADEALAILARAAAIPAGRAEARSETGWILFNLGRDTEAEAAIDESLQLQVSRAAIFVKVQLALERGDLADAQAAIAKIPPATLRSDAGAALAARVWLTSREPEKALELLRAIPREYLSSNTGGGVPTDLFRGQAYQLQGKAQAAQNAWHAALRVVDNMLVVQPQQSEALFNRAYLLALLGEQDAAVAALRLYEEIAPTPPNIANQLRLVAVHALLEPPERVLDRLGAVLHGTKSGLLRVDPSFDSLRGQPRFEALLAQPQRSTPGSAGTTVSSPAPDPKSVVVLPFANLSGDPTQEYFSDGLTEEILNALARERDLRVVPRTSAFSFKDKNVPLAEIAQALNVAQIVEGRVQRAGNRVRIRCTLTRVADGFAVALPAFDRELKDGADIFSLEDEVAGAVVEKLTQRTTTTAPVAVLTKNPDAYDAYLRGRNLMNQTSPSWPKAVEAFRHAVDLDPQFALAWANLGQLSASLYAYGFDGAALASSAHAIAEAIRLQPGLSEAHLARAYYLQATLAPPDAVEHELEVAEGMRPNDPAILEFRASVEFARGGEESGIKLMQRAVDLDPRNGANLNALGNELTSVGRYAEAEAVYRQAFQILGSSIPLTNRARIYFLWKGDRALATRTLDEAPEAIRDERYWTSRALLLYATGDQPGALAAAAHMKPRSEFFRIKAFFTARMREAMGDDAGAQRDYLAALPLAEQQRDEFPALPTPYAILGSVYAGLGRKAEALAAVQKAVEGDQPGAIGAATTGQPGLARKGIMAWTQVDLELDPHIALAQVQARFGMSDEALAIVQAAAAAGQLRRNYLLLSPDWAMLRKDPRFRAIAEKAPL